MSPQSECVCSGFRNELFLKFSSKHVDVPRVHPSGRMNETLYISHYTPILKQCMLHGFLQVELRLRTGELVYLLSEVQDGYFDARIVNHGWGEGTCARGTFGDHILCPAPFSDIWYI